MKNSNLKLDVVNYLIKNGFNCVAQPKSFPSIIAWKPFLNANKQPILMDTQFESNGQILSKQFVPFFVSMVECKSKKYLSKEEKEKVNKLLTEGRCDVFVVAYRKNRKLEFQETTLNFQKPEEQLKTIPSYFG